MKAENKLTVAELAAKLEVSEGTVRFSLPSLTFRVKIGDTNIVLKCL